MLRPPTRHGLGEITVPHHLLLGPETHGVTRYAGEVAGAAGALIARDMARLVPGDAVHLHITDRLLGRDPAAAADVVEALARRVRLTLTLHDVPQPSDGPPFRARAAAYARMVRASHAWATNSWHEHALVGRWCDPDARGTVIPLPVLRAGTSPAAGGATVADGHPGGPGHPGQTPAIGVFGFVYPGKGHHQVVRAAAALRRGDTDVRVQVLGGAAPGHDAEVDELVRRSRARGVPLEVTGRVAEPDLHDLLRRVAVPVVAHRNVSASGSLNSWIAAGRRPLVRDGVYAREMHALRPGTITLFDDSTLVPALEAALSRPATTWTPPEADLGPDLTDTVSAYCAWWAAVAR